MERKRILIVDDEPGLTQILQLNLAQTGRYDVRTVNKGSDAVTIARTFQPDLILLDVVMPDVDGGQIAQRMKLEPSLHDIPIVFLTAIVSKRETMGHLSIIGGCPFLAKPVSTDEVVACIEQHT